ncbi:MAG: DnaJ domain-containing protein [Alphaproteobacteria bacterium]|nr:DnaJ domain-containing protein [Alphaproteobacteria bacterium]
MQFMLIGLVLLAVVILVAHGLRGANSRRLARHLQLAGGGVLTLAAAVLMTRGAAVAAIPIAVLGMYLMSKASLTGVTPTPGNTSEVKTDYLEMQLDHETGEIRGRVIKGIFAGRRIERLKPAELALLWQDVRVDDAASAQLIEAYLDRVHPTWRDDIERGEKEMAGPDGRMTKEEAYEILGLKPGVGVEEIRRAHKELMLKLHPDRGGSTYLAAKINEAKTVLLAGN